MKTSLKHVCNRIGKLVVTHAYTAFFIVLGVLLSAPMAAWVCSIVLVDLNLPKAVSVCILYLSVLGAVVVALSLGKSDATAKETFWLWIVLSALLTLFVALGKLEIVFFRWMVAFLNS
jgi:hypothetical protein